MKLGDMNRLNEAYYNIRENTPVPITNPMKNMGAINNYTSQYQQNNPTKAVQSSNVTTNTPNQQASSSRQITPQQQMNEILARLGNLEARVSDLIARQSTNIM